MQIKDYKIHRYSSQSLRKNAYFPQNTSVVQCVEGIAEIEVNSHRISLRSGMNFLLNSTSFVKIISMSEDAKFTTLQFASRFIWENCPYITNHIFDIIGSVRADVYSEDNFRFGTLMFQQIDVIDKIEDYSFRKVVIANMLTNYFLTLYETLRNRVEKERSTASSHIDSLLGQFWILCKEQHTRHRKVEYYAEKLNISPRYLHRISKEHFGIAPKQVIDHCILNSAKRLLITSAKTSQEISIELSFPDQATFGQFFKRRMGISPSQYRHSQFATPIVK